VSKPKSINVVYVSSLDLCTPILKEIDLYISVDNQTEIENIFNTQLKSFIMQKIIKVEMRSVVNTLMFLQTLRDMSGLSNRMPLDVKSHRR